MPILQNKLVMKSIEALHDEALSLVPDNASNRGATAPLAALPAAPLQESPINAPPDKSENAPPDEASDHDIMARIDHLLKKLDETDDVTVAPPPDESNQSDAAIKTDVTCGTPTADNITTNNPINTDDPILSVEAYHTNENKLRDTDSDDIVDDTANGSLTETDNDAKDTINGLTADDQQVETEPTDQAKTLADIAAAIYQERQQTVDAIAADASQNNIPPFDINTLSASVADEVRRTVSALIAAELPQMVNSAVSEAIRALPADTRDQLTPTTGKSPAAKNVAVRKPAVIKKTSNKKPTAKKSTGKTPPKKKLNAKESKANKATTKKTTPST